ncbi:MAG: SHOCT domain-containing protein [Microbacteriaceae bacterium]
MNFWEVVGLFFWSFAFVAYLFVLFAILTDLFRDHSTNGWVKALWIILLVFVPFLTALIYLIARGSGMAERSMQAASVEKAATDDYIRTVANQTPTQQIQDAKNLLDSGAISQPEYEALKARAMGAHPVA